MRVTSNGSVVTLGKGQVWGPGRRLPYRQAFVDPATGAAVFYGIVTNVVRSARAGARADGEDHWWFYVARLKVEGARITEIEEISYEPPQGGFGATPSLALPDRTFDARFPSERSSRDEPTRSRTSIDAVSHRITSRTCRGIPRSRSSSGCSR